MSWTSRRSAAARQCGHAVDWKWWEETVSTPEDVTAELERLKSDVQHVLDVLEIQSLKAAFFRFIDTEQWDALGDTLTEDAQIFFEDSRFPVATTPAWDGRDAWLHYMTTAHPEKITVHQALAPEIQLLDENTATGIWAMSYWVDDPGRQGAWRAYGHEHDRYVRCPDGRWRIASSHVTHLRVDDVPRQQPRGAPNLYSE
jgi:SnoaL-like domain